MDFEIEPSRLALALKVVLPFASTDVSRPNLNGVAIVHDDGCLAFVATNGHALARLQLADLSYARGQGQLALLPLANAKALMQRAKGYKVGTFRMLTKDDQVHARHSSGEWMNFDNGKGTFPPYDKVIPDAPGKTACTELGVAPAYLGLVADAASLLAGKRNARPLCVYPPADPLSPFRFDIADEGSYLTCVVMPMRL